MSDYLTMLAARTLGTLPVVVPRRPSRFEPESSAGASPFDEVGTVEQDAAGRRVRVNPADPSTLSDAATPAKGGAVERVPWHESPLHRTPTPNAFGQKDRSERAASSAAVAQPGRLRVERQNVDADGKVSSRSNGRPSERSPMPRPDAGRQRLAEARRNRIDQAPAIHITIGRVDVRAVHRPEPAQAGPKTPAVPRATLGDYLRQRRD